MLQAATVTCRYLTACSVVLCQEPFSYYDLERIAWQSGFQFAYGVVFDRCVFPGYTNRKALDRKSEWRCFFC